MNAAVAAAVAVALPVRSVALGGGGMSRQKWARRRRKVQAGVSHY